MSPRRGPATAAERAASTAANTDWTNPKPQRHVQGTANHKKLREYAPRESPSQSQPRENFYRLMALAVRWRINRSTRSTTSAHSESLDFVNLRATTAFEEPAADLGVPPSNVKSSFISTPRRKLDHHAVRLGGPQQSVAGCQTSSLKSDEFRTQS